MQLGMIGLGRMGGNMVRRLIKGGHESVVFARSPESVNEFVKIGAIASASISDLVNKLKAPRVVWIMVPAGEATNILLEDLKSKLSPGDVVIDGGNSNYLDSVVHAKSLSDAKVDFMDVGTSGGIYGLERGYCLMIGGKKESYTVCEPIFKTLAPENGYLHCGPAGAGHFVKMIHNGIEYGLMQAYAEGFDLLKGANKSHLPEERRYELDVGKIAELWRHGSVVTSWLLDLTAQSLNENPELNGFVGHVPDSGEGRWTVNAAIEQGTAANVLTSALYSRFRSRIDHSFGEKLLSAMRSKFGGHSEGASNGRGKGKAS